MGGLSGGMSMARDRNHSNTNYTYLGQDSQTNPLMDYGQLLSGFLNQNRAQTNSLYGGQGYGNSYGKAPAYGSQSRSGGSGGGAPPAAGGGYSSTMGSNGSGRYDVGSGGRPDQGVLDPRLGFGGGDTAGEEFNLGGQYGNIGRGDTIASPPPGYGSSGEGPYVGINQNYLGPNGDSSDAFFPRDPNVVNDGDNARPSPIRPQGSNIDSWSGQLDEGMGAPDGGLYGALNDWASGSRTPYEQQIGNSYMNQYNDPNDPYIAQQLQQLYRNPESDADLAALDSNKFLASGGMTGLEGQTRAGYAQDASGYMPQEAWQSRQGYVNQTTGATGTENQDREALLAFLNGGGGFGGNGSGMGGGGGSLSGSSSPVGLGAGYAGALAAFQGMASGNGYSDAEKAAITNEGMGSARASLDTAQQEMMRRGELTGNRAGMYGGMASLANSRASTLGSQARQNTVGFANEAERRKEAGAAGMGGLAGIEGSLANAQLSANTAMNSQNSQNQIANRGMNLSAIQGLGNWDQQQRQNTLAGLGGMTNWDAARQQNMQFGQTGMQQGDATRRTSMLAGTSGLGDYGEKLFGRKAGALGGMSAYGQQGRTNQMNALTGANNWANQGRANQQFGVQGLSGLYNTQNANQGDFLNKLFQLFSTPQEKHTDGTDTSGSGGFGGQG